MRTDSQPLLTHMCPRLKFEEDIELILNISESEAVVFHVYENVELRLNNQRFCVIVSILIKTQNLVTLLLYSILYISYSSNCVNLFHYLFINHKNL